MDSISIRLGIIFCCFIAVGIVVGRAMPVTHTTTYLEQHVRKVTEQKTVVVVPIPAKRTYPPLNDPKLACTTAPVVIVDKTESAAQGGDEKTNYTWFTVRPAGDDYTMACHKPGSYSWEKGDLVVLHGEPTG